MARRTIDYCGGRTSHGSTLSFVTHAPACWRDSTFASSWNRFMVALESDLSHVQGGIAKEGIHMGAMSATLDLLQRSFLGSSITDGVLRFQPRLLDCLDGVSFSMRSGARRCG